MKKLRTIALYVLIGIPVFLGIVIAITQTQTFRNRLRAYALSTLDSLVDGDVTLGRLNGDLITGFSIDSVAVNVHDGPFLRIPRIDIAYNFFALPGKTIAIRKLTLTRPVITLYRPRGGRWNLSDLLRERPPDTAASKPFNWVIDVQRFEILDGTVSVLDSASLADEHHPELKPGEVEFHDFTLDGVNLVLSANIRNERQRAVITSCSFSSAAPDFRLKMFSGVFTLTPNEARVDSMRIITGKTKLWLDASMKDVDLRGGIELAHLQRAPVELSLIARPIDIDELKAFLPPLAFLAGRPEIALQVSGPFGDLDVRKLDLRFDRSSLFLRGAVTNLHDPPRLALNVKVTESTVEGTDVQALLPGLDLPDLSPLGTTTLNLEYEGIPLDFRTKFLVETAAGKVQSSGLRLTVGGPSNLGYDGTILFRKLNLGRALGDDGLESSLNGTLNVQGKGTTLRQLVSTFGLELDSSRFRGLPITATRASLQGSGSRMSGSVNMSLGDMQARLTGDLQQAAGKEPAFHLEGDVSSLNLEHILHDSTFNSDITMKFNAAGSGLSWGTVNADVTLDLSSSRYRDYTLDQGAVHLVLDQKDSTNKRLQVESNVADLTLTGAFDLKYMVNLFGFEAASIGGAIVDRLSLIEPALSTKFDRGAVALRSRPLLAAPRTLNAQYVLHVKNLVPLSSATGSTSFDGTGVASGSIRGGYGDLAFTCDLAMDDFFYGKADAGVLIEDAKVKLDVNSLGPVSPIEGAAIRLDASAGKVHINRNTLDSLTIAVNYARARASYSARTALNSDYLLASTGGAQVDENSVSVTPSTLEIAYRDYLWRADPGATLRVNHVGAELSRFVLRRDSQFVAVDAKLGAGRKFDGSVDGKNLDLEGLKHLLGGEESPGDPKTFTGNAQFSVKGSGTFDDPVISGTLEADSVTFRSLPFGRLSSKLQYGKGALEGHVRLVEPGKSAESDPIMTIDGVVPLEIGSATAGGDSARSAMNLHVLSHGAQISILEPLLHTFNRLKGLMSCDLTLGGTLKEPTYTGTLGLSQCSFLFLPNNIEYTLDGTFKPEGERIRVIDCTIKNVPEDVRAGREGIIHIGGDFGLRNLRPGEFNLTADGRLLVVKESTEKSSLAVYGDLFVEMGPGPLHFTGEIGNSLMKGSLSVRNSSLIFPPSQSGVTEESPESVRLVFVNDTLKVTKKAERSAVAKYFADTAGIAAAGDPGEKKTKSFMDGLRYDLDIDATGGTTEIRLIFNPVTNEELVATIDGKFTVTEDGRRWTGDLTISRAYYNFLKRFDATGSIRYTGDFLNPELNITATYQGTRTLDTSVTSSTKSASEKVVVNLKITGTRKAPKVEFAMTINDVDYYSYTGLTSHDLPSDAISFIVAGTFPLNSNQRSDLPSSVQSVAGSLSGASSVLTGKLSEFLKSGTGLDIGVDLNVGGKEGTELGLSGTVAKGYIRYKGALLNDPLANANVSILYSFMDIFDNPAFRNLMLELERRVEPGVYGDTNNLKRVNSARVYYRFSF